jgi:hypothetical protein
MKKIKEVISRSINMLFFWGLICIVLLKRISLDVNRVAEGAFNYSYVFAGWLLLGIIFICLNALEEEKVKIAIYACKLIIVITFFIIFGKALLTIFLFFIEAIIWPFHRLFR